MGIVSSGQDEEIALDSEVTGITVTLEQLAEPPPPPPALTPAPGFGDDEWATRFADGRVLAFLREPVARCHFDRLLLVDGERRFERALPNWVYHGQFVVPGPRDILIGGATHAWRLDPDGTLTAILEEADGQTVHVAWRGDTAVAAGWQTIVLDGPDGRVLLPCNHAAAACVVAGIVVISDDDGSQWIDGGRVVARDWRPYREGRGDVVLSMAGEAYRVRVTRG
jgi:hypothetical protein